MVLNEVYTGAGLSATMIPEVEIEVSEAFGTTTGSAGKVLLIDNDSSDGYTSAMWNTAAAMDNRLVTNIYKGCMARVSTHSNNGNTPSTEFGTQTLLIKSNTNNRIYFSTPIGDTNNEKCTLTILSYGAPINSPTASGKVSLLADNWLGLVNTITPPTVDAEMKQINLALGGTRNFGFQFKGAETLGEASIDVSLNNGMWLYYALGKIKTLTSSDALGSTLMNNTSPGAAGKAYTKASGTTKIYRLVRNIAGNGNIILPTPPAGTTASDYAEIESTDVLNYTFDEANSGDLPSFALEITAQKDGMSTFETDSGGTEVWTRIYTGCQMNTFTLNFEEGQEVKATIGAVSRKAHDPYEITNVGADGTYNTSDDTTRNEDAYDPKRNVTANTSLFNYNETADNTPFEFAHGHIEMFGQTLARVKSGTFTLMNTLTPQRYIGQYDRKITSVHTAGQRTYELQLNLQVTDRSIWDKLRSQDELQGAGNRITLKFDKSPSGAANTDYFHIKLDDYLVTAVDVPFPEDKGMLDVALTVQARSLSECKYVGKWVIQS